MKKQKTIKIISSPYAHSFESADLLESSPHALLQMTKLICILPISVGMNNQVCQTIPDEAILPCGWSEQEIATEPNSRKGKFSIVMTTHLDIFDEPSSSKHSFLE
jgi:hypothetical protein